VNWYENLFEFICYLKKTAFNI